MSDTYGARLAAIRRKAGLTMDEAAARTKQAPAGRGVSKTSISEYENGHTIPGADAVVALAWAYNADPADLLPDDRVGAA